MMARPRTERELNEARGCSCYRGERENCPLHGKIELPYGFALDSVHEAHNPRCRCDSCVYEGEAVERAEDY
jgi:hypothetical protein